VRSFDFFSMICIYFLVLTINFLMGSCSELPVQLTKSKAAMTAGVSSKIMFTSLDEVPNIHFLK
jgi:hypothetical protein